MIRLAIIFLVALGVAGCAAPRYHVTVTAVAPTISRAEWMAVRVDQQTGTSWYLHDDGTGRKVEWQPILESDVTTKK